MSTSPPPPPFRAAPTRYSSSLDRRVLRAQRRAAAAQGRQQAALVRAQMRAARRTSATGAVLLIGLGTLFFLLEIGHVHWRPLLFAFARWWPLVLVGAGAILLLEWAWDRHQSDAAGTMLQPRRSLGTGTAMLLIFLTLSGALAMAVENRSDWIRQQFDENDFTSDLPWWSWVFGGQSVAVFDVSGALPKGGLLTVADPRGKITITGSSTDGQIHITVRRHAFVWVADHNRDTHDPPPQLRAVADGLTFDLGRDQSSGADLTIQMPHEAALRLGSSRGELSVSELRGAVDLQEHSGNVQLTALTGNVHVTMRDDDATVSGHSLSGGLTMEGRSGDLTLSDINGPVNLHGDFFGTTHLERVHGDVRFVSSFTNFACAGIPGELTIDGRQELEGQELEGPVTLATTDRNLKLSGVRGGATITDSNGSVHLAITSLGAPVHVTTTDGSVTLNVPDKSAFILSAQTKDGHLTNDFGFPLQEHEDRSILTGQVGRGGPAISLETTEGDVAVLKASNTDWDTDEKPKASPAAVEQPPSTKEHGPHPDKRKH